MTSRQYSYPNGLNGTIELAFNVANFAEVDTEYERVVKAGERCEEGSFRYFINVVGKPTSL